MRSIPWAIVWEMLFRGRWTLIGAAIGANFLPLILESALQRTGAIDSADSSQIIIHVMLLQLNVFMFGAAVMAAQGPPSRLYTAPIRTSTLVIWHLLPAMILMGLQSALSVLALNALFPLNWPVWGPALFAAISIAAIYAGLWQSDKTAWCPFILGAIATILGLWFKSRHGSTFGQATHYWSEVTLVDVLTLLSFAAFSYYFAVQGVARSRRGDQLQSWGIVEWLTRVFDPAPVVGLPFPSPHAAQFWFVWCQKGWAMPACVAVVLIFTGTGWLIADRTAESLLKGLEAGGMLLSLTGMLGAIVIGNCGSADSNFEIGGFLGTRPMSSRDMSRIILKTILRSVLLAWAFWAIASLGSYLFIRALGLQFNSGSELKLGEFAEKLGWWYIPLTLLGPWIVAGCGASLGLTGRNWLFTSLVGGVITLFASTVAVSQIALTRESELVLGKWVTAIIGIAFVVATIAAYFEARRWKLIEPLTPYLAAMTWILLCVPVVLTAMRYPQTPVTNYILLVGLMALVVAPVSTIPLALSWNRVR